MKQCGHADLLGTYQEERRPCERLRRLGSCCPCVRSRCFSRRRRTPSAKRLQRQRPRSRPRIAGTTPAHGRAQDRFALGAPRGPSAINWAPDRDESELEAALFADGLSTRTEGRVSGGRGAGLGAVRACCAALGGAISIGSQLGRGTTSRFGFPRAALGNACGESVGGCLKRYGHADLLGTYKRNEDHAKSCEDRGPVVSVCVRDASLDGGVRRGPRGCCVLHTGGVLSGDENRILHERPVHRGLRCRRRRLHDRLTERI